MMTIIRVLLTGSLLTGCPMMKSKPTSPSNTTEVAKPEAPRVVSEGSGSHVVTGYNHAQKELEQAGPDDKEGWHALAAHQITTKTKQFVTDAKSGGTWADGLRYETASDGTFSEAEMLEHLDDLAKRADEAWEKAKPAAAKTWKQAYGATSKDAVAKLEELGKPNRVEKTKKGTCWYFESDEGKQQWCWTKAGKLGDHKVEPAESAAVADDGGEAPKHGSYKKVSVFNGQASCAGGSWASGKAVILDTDGSYKECDVFNGQCNAPGSWARGKAVVRDSDGAYKECEIFNGQANCAGASWYKGDAVIWCED